MEFFPSLLIWFFLLCVSFFSTSDQHHWGGQGWCREWARAPLWLKGKVQSSNSGIFCGRKTPGKFCLIASHGEKYGLDFRKVLHQPESWSKYKLCKACILMWKWETVFYTENCWCVYVNWRWRSDGKRFLAMAFLFNLSDLFLHRINIFFILV